MIKFKSDIVGPRNRYVKIVKYMGKTVRRRSVGYILAFLYLLVQ